MLSVYMQEETTSAFNIIGIYAGGNSVCNYCYRYLCRGEQRLQLMVSVYMQGETTSAVNVIGRYAGVDDVCS